MTQATASHDAYLSACDRVQRTSEVLPAVGRLRVRALERFVALGFPTTRHEEWRFTNVAPIAETAFALADPGGVEGTLAAALEPFTLRGARGSQVVFVDGRFVPALSALSALPHGVEVRSLADALADDPTLVDAGLGRLASIDQQAFTALNTAFLVDGAVVRIPPAAVVDAPVHVLFASSGRAATMSHPRVLVVAGPNSQVHLVESYVGLGASAYFTNAVTEIVGGENAVVDHYKLVREGVAAFHVAGMHVSLGRSATFCSHAITLGGALVRNEVETVLNGDGIDCTLNGLYLVNGRRHVDNHTTIDHARPHCGSHELYKGILQDQGRAVFNGKIIVRIDAQKTDAKQTNKALLLSEDAQINTKPQLEIFADDVKCTHGATVGQLDEDALFYLRSRGLPFERARSVLIHGFASDLLNRIKIPPIRAELDRVLLEQLPGSGGGTFYEHPD